MTGLEAEVRDAAHRDDVGAAWERLEAAVGDGTVVRSWAWTRTWLEHFGDLLDHRFVLLHRDGELRAATVLVDAGHFRRGPLRLRTLHLGTTGEPEADSVCTPYNGVLCAPGEEEAAAAAVLRCASADRRWDELRLDGLSSDQANAFRAADAGLAARHEESAARDLEAVRSAGTTVAAALSRKLRYQLRRTESGIGAVHAHAATTREEARDILEELVVLHTERWEREGQPGAFASPRFAGFHRALLDALPLDSLILLRARTATRTVGCVYGFVQHGAVLMYQGGFGAFDDPRAKPGFVTHVHCMQAALERGLGRYDLLTGDSAYKRELTDTAGGQVSLRAVRRRLRHAPVVAARRVREVVRG